MPETASIHSFIQSHQALIDLLTELDDQRTAYEISTAFEAAGRDLREEFEIEFEELSDREIGMFVTAWEATHLDQNDQRMIA